MRARSLAGSVRAGIYNVLFAHLTARWYAAALACVPKGSRLLDVGIGTGAALAANAEQVRAAGLRIVGIDIDPDYVERCRRALARAGLPDVEVRLALFGGVADGPYDAVYFAGSFMLLDEPAAALEHARRLLAPGGRVLFTQTMEERRTRLLERIKPHLHRVTTVRFGRVTYLDAFRRTLEESGYTIDAVERIPRGGVRTRLVVARPRPSD